MDDCMQADANTFSHSSTSIDADRFQYEARFPEYNSFVERLNSYESTQKDPVEIRHLAEAGYFDPGRPNTVQCFYCGLRLAFEGQGKDNPWRDHAKYVRSKGCAYLSHMKNKIFVQTKGQEMGVAEQITCFDRGGGESGWIPCKSIDCRLCVWEFVMTPPEDENDSD